MRQAFIGSKILAVSALLAIVMASGVPVRAGEDPIAALDAMLEAQSRELVLPGVSAALMDHGKIVWTGARGFADVEARTPMTTETPFNIASLTKPMASVMLMQLVERGELSLDTPMQRYDAEYKDARITVGHVLSMASQGEPPGQHYAYDGNIYGSLGNVITGVTHQTLAQAFSTRLIEPLGLALTSPGDLSAGAQGLSADLAARYQAIFARVARPYNTYGGVETVPTFAPDATPNAAANVISTPSDYARFADAVLRGRLLKPETLKAMWAPHITTKGERLPYAYGWFVEDYQGHRLIYHYGYYDAYSAVTLLVPERELIFVALANTGGLSGHNGIDAIEGNVFACTVLNTFVDRALPCAEKAAANVARWRTRNPPQPEIVSDPATLPRFTGVYRLLSGKEATIELDQGRLWWHSPAGRFAMTQVGPGRFVLKADNRLMTFVFDDKGKVTRIDVTYPGDTNVYAVPRLR